MSADTSPYARIHPRWSFRMTWLRIVLLAVFGLMLGTTVYRMFFGLGAVTNFTDQWPWALTTWWKLAAVALAGAGYSTAFVVHFLGNHHWRNIERGAFVVSMLGYVMVCVCLFLDLGQWYNAWHPAFWWGYHSTMFELFFCISGYTIVQVCEFIYIFEERVPMPRFRPYLNKYYGVLLGFGAFLPVFHQSALCSLYVIAKGRLDPLWWSMLLPLFAVMTSFFVGPSVVTVENYVSARHYPRTVDKKILGQMVHISAYIMAGYLVLKVADYAVRGVLGELFKPSVLSASAWIELGLCTAVPMVMFFSEKVRASKAGMLTASWLAIAGVALNRFNIVILGMMNSTHAGFYRPYWMEVAFILGMAAGVTLAYLFILENFAILPKYTGAAKVPARLETA